MWHPPPTTVDVYLEELRKVQMKRKNLFDIVVIVILVGHCGKYN